MDYQTFIKSLSDSQTPDQSTVYLEALWHDAKGNWEKSHELIQDINNKDAAWIHAYLHRKESDNSNAAYWYARAGKSFPSFSIPEEWEQLVVYFTGK